jgi:flagellar hook-associated protein 3 FlgL
MINSNSVRVTTAVHQQQALAERLARLQTQVATGVRIATPADDPAAAARVSLIARRQADLATGEVNLRTAAANAGTADGILESATALTARARELIVQGASDTLADADRRALAIEMRSLSEQMAALPQTMTSSGDQLFASGTALAIPTIDGVMLRPVESAATIFGGITTPSGTSDAATILADAAAALENPVPAARRVAVADANTALAAVDERLILARADQGAAARCIDDMIDAVGREKLVRIEERSGLEDTDLTQALAQVQATQLTLEAAQGIFARLNRSTLFDLLR